MAILDLDSRRIVGCSMGDDLICRTLTMEYQYQRHQPKPDVIMLTDQGIQYVSVQYQRLVQQYAMTHFMSRRANA